MLKPKAKQVIVAVGCGIAMMLIAAWLSGSQGEICEQTKSGQEHCAVYNLSAYFLFKIGGFLNDSAVVISAVATGFIAWFTWTLWQSSEKMWTVTSVAANAAQLAANAAVGVEIPRIFIFDLEFQASPIVNDFGNLQFPKVAISIKNYGRTPAFLDDQCVEMRIATSLRDDPEYINVINFDPGTVIERDSTYDLPVARLRDALPIETINLIIEGKTLIWVYCYVRYRDFLNMPHRLAFGAHLRKGDNGGPRRFIFDAPKKYHENT
jgi:hypothetical protein